MIFTNVLRPITTRSSGAAREPARKRIFGLNKIRTRRPVKINKNRLKNVYYGQKRLNEIKKSEIERYSTLSRGVHVRWPTTGTRGHAEFSRELISARSTGADWPARRRRYRLWRARTLAVSLPSGRGNAARVPSVPSPPSGTRPSVVAAAAAAAATAVVVVPIIAR